jgi:hypothetical protein
MIILSPSSCPFSLSQWRHSEICIIPQIPDRTCRPWALLWFPLWSTSSKWTSDGRWSSFAQQGGLLQTGLKISPSAVLLSHESRLPPSLLFTARCLFFSVSFLLSLCFVFLCRLPYLGMVSIEYIYIGPRPSQVVEQHSRVRLRASDGPQVAGWSEFSSNTCSYQNKFLQGICYRSSSFPAPLPLIESTWAGRLV